MKLPAERIIEDAELTAAFFRALCDKGVPVMAAVQLTSSYVSSHMITRASRETPREPWEPDS